MTGEYSKPGGRASTGSEARRQCAYRDDPSWWLIFTAKSGQAANIARDREHADRMRSFGWDVVEVVKPDHDEQTEDDAPDAITRRIEAARAEGFRAGVKAVVEALEEEANREPRGWRRLVPRVELERWQWFTRAADFVAERFNLKGDRR